MSKTIKQIADEIGVSRQAVYQRIKRNPDLQERLQPFTVNVDNVVYIDVDGEQILKSAFNADKKGICADDAVNTPVNKAVNIDSDVYRYVDTNVYSMFTANIDKKGVCTDETVNTPVNVDRDVDNDVYSMFTALKATITTLEEQLAAKDKQIDSLTSALNQSQQALCDTTAALNQSQHALQETTAALNAAQALHAGTMQQQLTTSEPDAENTAVTNTEIKKKGFFSRLFGKHM